MRVLVTGGSGLLGSHVAERLTQAGHTVRALVRRTSNRKFLQGLAGIEFVEGTVEEPDSLIEAVKGVDAIVHSAALVKARNELEFFKTNHSGTQNLLAAAREHAPNLRRFVHVSSLEAVGPSKDGTPVNADSERRPVTRYGRSKLAAEQAAERFAKELPVTIVRPAAIYGPRDVEIFEAFRSISQGLLPILGDGSALGCWVYAPECADACISAIEREVPSGSAYFLSDGSVYTQKEAMLHLECALGKRAKVRVGMPIPLIGAIAGANELYAKLAGRAVMLTRDKVQMLARHWVCDPELAMTALAWQPKVKLDDGARLSASWYKDQGWLH